MDIFQAVYFFSFPFDCGRAAILFMFVVPRVKRKWALLESNLSGMPLAVRQNACPMGCHTGSPLLF
jgi:hypothetical protein